MPTVRGDVPGAHGAVKEMPRYTMPIPLNYKKIYESGRFGIWQHMTSFGSMIETWDGSPIFVLELTRDNYTIRTKRIRFPKGGLPSKEIKRKVEDTLQSFKVEIQHLQATEGGGSPVIDSVDEAVRSLFGGN